jgi:hypothetical protein
MKVQWQVRANRVIRCGAKRKTAGVAVFQKFMALDLPSTYQYRMDAYSAWRGHSPLLSIRSSIFSITVSPLRYCATF